MAMTKDAVIDIIVRIVHLFSDLCNFHELLYVMFTLSSCICFKVVVFLELHQITKNDVGLSKEMQCSVSLVVDGDNAGEEVCDNVAVVLQKNWGF